MNDPERKLAELEEVRGGARARAKAAEAARAAELLSQPLPTKAAMADEAMRVLRSLALNELAEDKDRVSAAKAIRDETDGAVDAKDLEPRKRLAMLDLERTELLRKIAELDGQREGGTT
jgi:hypothetical protein